MRRNDSKMIAFGGVMAALAIVIMCLGGLIPVATYVCPMMCCLILQIVFLQCGRKIAWAWYVAVSVMSLLIGPDKEAAVVYTFLGYYPILKPFMDRLRLRAVWKLILFNAASFAAYGILFLIMGVEELGFDQMGVWLIVILTILGNVTFFLLDKLLLIISVKISTKGNRRK